MVVDAARILMAAWSLLVAPTLCGAGMLSHTCRDNDSTTCHHAEESAERQSCDPEGDCFSDPCDVIVIRDKAVANTGCEPVTIDYLATPDVSVRSTVVEMGALIPFHPARTPARAPTVEFHLPLLI